MTDTAVDIDHFSPYRADGKLYGFVCVVTGAQHAIGQAIVKELATHGAACIYACDLITPTIDPLIASLGRTNTKVIPYPYNSTLESSTLTLIDDVLNTFGRLDIFVCSSSLVGPSTLSQTTPADLQKCLEANTMAPFFALKYAPAAMGKTTSKGLYANAAPKDVKYGSIIVVSSVASGYGGCGGPAHTIASHAALGVVRSGVPVLRGTGVRINCIAAGQIRDEGTESKSDSELIGGSPRALERAGTPVEVARVAGFLASGFSSYVHGASLVVDGGSTVMNPLTVPF